MTVVVVMAAKVVVFVSPTHGRQRSRSQARSSTADEVIVPVGDVGGRGRDACVAASSSSVAVVLVGDPVVSSSSSLVLARPPVLVRAVVSSVVSPVVASSVVAPVVADHAGARGVGAGRPATSVARRADPPSRRRRRSSGRPAAWSLVGVVVGRAVGVVELVGVVDSSGSCARRGDGELADRGERAVASLLVAGVCFVRRPGAPRWWSPGSSPASSPRSSSRVRRSPAVPPGSAAGAARRWRANTWTACAVGGGVGER